MEHKAVLVCVNVLSNLPPQHFECPAQENPITNTPSHPSLLLSFPSLSLTHFALPVKVRAARSGEEVTTLPNRGPSAGRKLITPSGTPASSKILVMNQFDRIAESDGFHRETLPMIVGVAARLPPMAVKLKGVIAAMKPSRPRYSILFQTPLDWRGGWSWWTCTAESAANR